MRLLRAQAILAWLFVPALKSVQTGRRVGWSSLWIECGYLCKRWSLGRSRRSIYSCERAGDRNCTEPQWPIILGPGGGQNGLSAWPGSRYECAERH